MARHHLAAVRQLDGPIEIVGVHDRAFGSAEEFAESAGAPAYRSASEMFEDARPDAVHVCTPPHAHFDAAAAALEAGAHIYVEKPFALTVGDASTLLERAHARGLLVCAGHQLLRDRAYEALIGQTAQLGTPVQVDSHFAFRPAGSAERRGPRMLAQQLIDILPHPLYVLISTLERFAAPDTRVELAWIHATPTDVQAMLRAGEITGRLSVSLRARPVASWLTLTGTRGSMTCDFVRSVVSGAGNPGTAPLEKILNPMVEAGQLVSRTALSLAKRVRSGASYPGLADLIGAFYDAVAGRAAVPVSPAHLLRVTQFFQQLTARIESSADRVSRRHSPAPAADRAQVTVVTGARGFLGSEIVRTLPDARCIGRDGWPDATTHEWVVADLSQGVPAEALARARVVVHAAAETSGGYEAHQRNTIDATRHLLHAMHEAGVRRLVLVSSLSVVRPPRTPWERQHEETPRPRDPRPLGAYTWGKCMQEELVEREAAALGIETRIIRPGALIDFDDPSMPGLMGRRLFGRWHLGLGGPHLPIAVCDVKSCARAIAWSVAHFDEAPRVVNLIDPALGTRGALVTRFRARGRDVRMVWLPISVLAAGLSTARTLVSLAQGRLPERLAVWSILRPRRFDTRVSETLLDAAGLATEPVQPSTPRLSGAPSLDHA
jgi:predicted dehydrogenase/nucleoside-diphosphate-sugar epimerase